MKKRVIFIAIFILILLTTGCGKNETLKETETNTYQFTYQEKKLTLGDEFTSDELGEYIDYAEVASCAFEGLDKTYTYDHFELTTYPDGNKDRIYSIYFLDNEIKTTEGLKIGDTLNDLLNKYGDDYKRENNLYTYTKDKTSLKFIVENNNITSIEYSYDA